MKKFLTFIAVSVLALCLIVFVGCGMTLDTPEKIRIDDDYLMTWSNVEYARTYSLEIKSLATGETDTVVSRKTSYSLSAYEEGDYEIRIKAVPRDNSAKESDWSEVVAFHKNYETGCVYKLINNNTEYAITGAGTSSDSFTIEDIYRGKPVTAIENSAFRASKVKNIVIGNNVRSIGDDAFYNCPDLETVVIPQSVTSIGSAAFHSCLSLKSVTFPEGVTTVNSLTFAYCRELEEVVLGSNVTSIGESAFYGCNSLKEIELPQSLQIIYGYAFSDNAALERIEFGSNLIYIGDNAFFRCVALSEITFAEDSSLVQLAAYAFSGCVSLTRVDLPEGLQSLGIRAFSNCTELSEVTLPQTLTGIGSSAFNGTKIYTNSVENGDNLIYAGNWVVAVKDSSLLVNLTPDSFKPDTVGIVGKAFMRCVNLETVVLPSSIKYLGTSCFALNEKLHRVTLPDNGVETIGDSAFISCEALNNLRLGEGLKSIGRYAFYGCTRLYNNTQGDLIPESVTSIGEMAFNESGLWTQPDEYGIIYAGNWVVGYNTESSDGSQINISSVILKSDTRGISDYALLNCLTLRDIRGGISNVRYLGTGAFYNCQSLSAITLDDNIQEIGDYTFYRCWELFRIDIPANLKKIGRSAFYDCRMLSELDLSGGRVEEIGQFAFFRCKNIVSIDFGSDLKQIGACSFMNCTSLKSIEIPDSVVSIEAMAFQQCESLEKVGFAADSNPNLSYIGQYAFALCVKLGAVDFPSSLRSISAYAFSGCDSLSQIEFSEGIEEIGQFAFYGNTNLTSLSLPKSLKKIGEQAFRDCYGLSSVLLYDSIEEVAAHAFYGCYQLTIYCDADSVPEGWSTRWNSSYRPVMLGCVLSDDGRYVVSITVDDDLMLNVERLNENGDDNPVLVNNRFSPPRRIGYSFVGWTTQSGGTTAEIAAGDIADVQNGTVLYAVWEEKTESPEPPEEENPENPDGDESEPMIAA